MRILADYHHSDLFESYQLTLEDRFGWEVFAPYGMEWFDAGYWNFERQAHGDAVARQYLLGVWPDPVDRGTHWEVEDRTHPGRIRKGVTLGQALDQDWDVVLCSLTHNEAGFAELAEFVGATFGIQAGNVGQVDSVNWGPVDFGLLSTTLGSVVPPVPHIVYRQEFSLDDFRYEWPPSERDTVASFIQCFPENQSFYDDFLNLARNEDGFDWKVYGAYGSHPEDEFACGNLNTTPAVAEAMRRTRTAYHAKWWSDGYGHVIHNLAAVGRPVVGPLGYYGDKLAGPLHIDGVTSFDTAQRTTAEVLAVLRRLRDDDDFHRKVCEAAAFRFREVVNFDDDAWKVRTLIESVL